MQDEWYYRSTGEDLPMGPLTAQELRHAVQQGKISAHSYVRRGDRDRWVAAPLVRGLLPDAAPAAVDPEEEKAETEYDLPLATDEVLEQAQARTNPLPPVSRRPSGRQPSPPTRESNRQSSSAPRESGRQRRSGRVSSSLRGRRRRSNLPVILVTLLAMVLVAIAIAAFVYMRRSGRL